jgi:hypothetical protein
VLKKTYVETFTVILLWLCFSLLLWGHGKFHYNR